jgi:hypothetical protein
VRISRPVPDRGDGPNSLFRLNLTEGRDRARIRLSVRSCRQSPHLCNSYQSLALPGRRDLAVFTITVLAIIRL